MNEIQAAQERFQQKRRDYINTFTGEVSFQIGRWKLFRLAVVTLFSPRELYRLTLRGALNQPHPAAQGVIDDLRKLAGIDSGGLVYSPVTRVVDSNATCYRAGLRDMYLRIVKFIGLDESEL